MAAAAAAAAAAWQLPPPSGHCRGRCAPRFLWGGMRGCLAAGRMHMGGAVRSSAGTHGQCGLLLPRLPQRPCNQERMAPGHCCRGAHAAFATPEFGSAACGAQVRRGICLLPTPACTCLRRQLSRSSGARWCLHVRQCVRCSACFSCVQLARWRRCWRARHVAAPSKPRSWQSSRRALAAAGEAGLSPASAAAPAAAGSSAGS